MPKIPEETMQIYDHIKNFQLIPNSGHDCIID